MATNQIKNVIQPGEFYNFDEWKRYFEDVEQAAGGNHIWDDDTWQALVSGGSLRVAVVCRHKLDPIPELEKVSALDPRGSCGFPNRL